MGILLHGLFNYCISYARGCLVIAVRRLLLYNLDDVDTWSLLTGPLTVRCDAASGRIKHATLQASTWVPILNKTLPQHQLRVQLALGSSRNSQTVHWSLSVYKHFIPNSNCTDSSLSSALPHLDHPPQSHVSLAPFNLCVLSATIISRPSFWNSTSASINCIHTLQSLSSTSFLSSIPSITIIASILLLPRYVPHDVPSPLQQVLPSHRQSPASLE